jgi:tRNA U34 2-thiouridine synthase MnmA/TrmU
MKAICVFSGGLDSMLAAELLRAQGIDVLGFFFETPFFSPKKATKSAQSMGLPIKVVDITKRHMAMLKHPKHGYGANMNPCIDCHALMFKIAGEMLEKERADFVLTGEVLGQRPMSQNKKSLALIAFESGLGGLLLRPLSAKRLPMTIPEEKGWVKRDLLMDFQGRSRKPQIELAKTLNIEWYPSPAGGCLLTEEVFSRRLKDLFSSQSNQYLREIELLKLGRHFRVSAHTKLVVGRNKDENNKIRTLSGQNDLILIAAFVPGPTVLYSGCFLDASLELAAAITASYSDVEDFKETAVRVIGGSDERMLMTKVHKKEEFKRYMI